MEHKKRLCSRAIWKSKKGGNFSLTKLKYTRKTCFSISQFKIWFDDEICPIICQKYAHGNVLFLVLYRSIGDFVFLTSNAVTVASRRPLFYPNQFLARLYNSNRTHSVINIVLFLLAVLRLWFQHFSGQKFDFMVIIKHRDPIARLRTVWLVMNSDIQNNVYVTPLPALISDSILHHFFATICY